MSCSQSVMHTYYSNTELYNIIITHVNVGHVQHFTHSRFRDECHFEASAALRVCTLVSKPVKITRVESISLPSVGLTHSRLHYSIHITIIVINFHFYPEELFHRNPVSVLTGCDDSMVQSVHKTQKMYLLPTVRCNAITKLY